MNDNRIGNNYEGDHFRHLTVSKAVNQRGKVGLPGMHGLTDMGVLLSQSFPVEVLIL